ncbi:rhomboid family intramembrane serine protease [Marinicella sp. S1101]|uniref:rhomboid family intramembrane serine protease n=1 Tax=Marinicella marina TaxID=2996016 RepID=UPI00226097A6|nr:rhomboid family intramembrane serine protease [Marinicella marina]MCX7555073.1 rhomboid family intramembrane serine protease [Marinicella marina]MDJ1141381.1 rhomboid family intramembrane serine protease [Marinicella marina]
MEINQTIIIIIVTCVISYMAWQNRQIMERLIFWSPAIKEGQVERFVTHGFIHADGMHLLFNMFTFYFFGGYLEGFYRQYFGGAGFVIFYLGAIVVAMLPSYFQHKNDRNYMSLGASGAVSAVLFAFILFAPWELLYLFAAIPIPAIVFAVAYVWYSIWAGKQNNDNINHSAHLYGALYGVIVTLILEPRLIQVFFSQLFNPTF